MYHPIVKEYLKENLNLSDSPLSKNEAGRTTSQSSNTEVSSTLTDKVWTYIYDKGIKLIENVFDEEITGVVVAISEEEIKIFKTLFYSADPKAFGKLSEKDQKNFEQIDSKSARQAIVELNELDTEFTESYGLVSNISSSSSGRTDALRCGRKIDAFYKRYSQNSENWDYHLKELDKKIGVIENDRGEVDKALQNFRKIEIWRWRWLRLNNRIKEEISRTQRQNIIEKETMYSDGFQMPSGSDNPEDSSKKTKDLENDYKNKVEEYNETKRKLEEKKFPEKKANQADENYNREKEKYYFDIKVINVQFNCSKKSKEDAQKALKEQKEIDKKINTFKKKWSEGKYKRTLQGASYHGSYEMTGTLLKRIGKVLGKGLSTKGDGVKELKNIFQWEVLGELALMGATPFLDAISAGMFSKIAQGFMGALNSKPDPTLNFLNDIKKGIEDLNEKVERIAEDLQKMDEELRKLPKKIAKKVKIFFKPVIQQELINNNITKNSAKLSSFKAIIKKAKSPHSIDTDNLTYQELKGFANTNYLTFINEPSIALFGSEFNTFFENQQKPEVSTKTDSFIISYLKACQEDNTPINQIAEPLMRLIEITRDHILDVFNLRSSIMDMLASIYLYKDKEEQNRIFTLLKNYLDNKVTDDFYPRINNAIVMNNALGPAFANFILARLPNGNQTIFRILVDDKYLCIRRKNIVAMEEGMPTGDDYLKGLWRIVACDDWNENNTAFIQSLYNSNELLSLQSPNRLGKIKSISIDKQKLENMEKLQNKEKLENREDLEKMTEKKKKDRKEPDVDKFKWEIRLTGDSIPKSMNLVSKSGEVIENVSFQEIKELTPFYEKPLAFFCSSNYTPIKGKKKYLWNNLIDNNFIRFENKTLEINKHSMESEYNDIDLLVYGEQGFIGYKEDSSGDTVFENIKYKKTTGTFFSKVLDKHSFKNSVLYLGADKKLRIADQYGKVIWMNNANRILLGIGIDYRTKTERGHSVKLLKERNSNFPPPKKLRSNQKHAGMISSGREYFYWGIFRKRWYPDEVNLNTFFSGTTGMNSFHKKNLSSIINISFKERDLGDYTESYKLDYDINTCRANPNWDVAKSIKSKGGAYIHINYNYIYPNYSDPYISDVKVVKESDSIIKKLKENGYSSTGKSYHPGENGGDVMFIFFKVEGKK